MRLDEETIAAFLDECQRHGCSLWTRRRHRRRLEDLARWLSGGRVGSSAGQDAQDGFLWRGQSHWNPDWTVIASRYAALVAFQGWLRDGRVVDVSDPATDDVEGGRS